MNLYHVLLSIFAKKDEDDNDNNERMELCFFASKSFIGFLMPTRTLNFMFEFKAKDLWDFKNQFLLLSENQNKIGKTKTNKLPNYQIRAYV